MLSIRLGVWKLDLPEARTVEAASIEGQSNN